MLLQRLRRLATAPLLSDGGLLVSLRSELNHELTNQSLKEAILPTGFSVEHDAPRSQDVFLRRRDGSSGESVVVSALLAPLWFNGEDAISREVSMKVCVEKPSFGSVLRFDCNVFGTSVDGFGESSDFDVKGVWYHSSVNESEIDNKYLGPEYSLVAVHVETVDSGPDLVVRWKRKVPCCTLDPNLQQAFKEYLVSRGVTTELTDFLLNHLHNKEQGQYVNWLETLEAVFAKDS